MMQTWSKHDLNRAFCVLTATDLLLDTKDNWTKSAYARFADGQPCGWSSKGVVKWCLMGALSATYKRDKCVSSALEEACMELRLGIDLYVINDFYGYKAVKRLLKRAIRLVVIALNERKMT